MGLDADRQTVEYAERASEFVAEKVDEADAEGVVVGLSGGIDSATASAVAVDALGADAVHGLIMPTEVSEDGNMRDARDHAESFGIGYEVVEIQPVVGSFLDARPTDDRAAVGNLAARVRMCFNYLVANEESLLVLGTGNRSEILTGYYTKYGDGGVDILPLGGLYKTEVREVARHLGVDESIVEKPPTAGLWKGQTDEDELGATYEQVDAVMRAYVDKGVTVGETVERTDVPRETVERLVSLYESSEHKRRMPPLPGFGRD